MGKQRYTPEEIIHKLREAEVLIGPTSVIYRGRKNINPHGVLLVLGD